MSKKPPSSSKLPRKRNGNIQTPQTRFAINAYTLFNRQTYKVNKDVDMKKIKIKV